MNKPQLGEATAATATTARIKFPQTEKALEYANQELAKIFQRLAGVNRLSHDCVAETVRDCSEYLRFAAMAKPHLQSHEQGCVAVFGASRAKELKHKSLNEMILLLNIIKTQKGVPGQTVSVNNLTTKAINKLYENLLDYRDKPAELPTKVCLEAIHALECLLECRDKRLLPLIEHNSTSLMQLKTNFKMHWIYQIAMGIGDSLCQQGFLTMSGGGPGAMEASCRGANPDKKIDGKVIAVAINIPGEPPNQYIPGQAPEHASLVEENPNLNRRSAHDKFTFRKWGLVQESNGLIVMPGGFGTMEEFLEVLSLISGGNIEQPVCFVGKRFWSPIIKSLRKEGFITEDLAKRISIADDPQQAVLRLKDYYRTNLTGEPQYKWPKRWTNLDTDLDRDFLVKRQTLPDGRNIDLFSFPTTNFEELPATEREHIEALTKTAQAVLAREIAQCPHQHNVTSEMLTGFYKFLIDALNIKVKMEEFRVQNGILLLGSQNLDHFRHLKEVIAGNGIPIVQKIGDGERGGIGITITVPNSGQTADQPPFMDVQIPARVRAIALDASAGNCNKIIIADGGIKALHRAMQYICWLQTGKLSDTSIVVIDPRDRFSSVFKAICEQTEAYGCTHRKERGLVQIFRSIEEAVAAGHKELANSQSA